MEKESRVTSRESRVNRSRDFRHWEDLTQDTSFASGLPDSRLVTRDYTSYVSICARCSFPE
jgi:hypothetical protein